MELLSFPAEVCAVVRPAGRGHVIGGAIDGKIHYVVPDSNGRTGSFPHHGPIKIRAIDITPSGNILASVCDNGEIIIGTYPQSTVRIGLGETQGITFKIALSPDAGTVLSYGLDNTVQIWDTFTRGRKFKLEALTEPVIDARFTPDGQYIVTVAKDNTLRLWNANNGTELQKITLPASPNGLTISKDSRLLATALGEGKSAQIILWSLPSPAQAIFTSKIAIPSRDPANPGDPGMNNANRMTAGLGRVFTTGVEPDSIRNIGYTGDGKKFVLVRRNGSVVIYDAETMKLLDTMEVDKECTAAALIGDLLFIANADNHLKYFDLGTQKLVKEFEPTKTTIRGIYPYSDQRTILCRDDAGFFSLIYGTAGNKPRHYATPINYAGPDPSRISLAPTTRRAYGIDGNHLISWAADDGSARKVVAEFDGIIQSFAISPQGARITGVTANSISTSDANGKLVAKILMRLGGLPADPPHGLQFIDGGRKIVGASYKGGVRVWDIAKGTLLQSLPGEFFSYEMSAVSPDGKLFAMISGLKLGGDNTMNVRNQLSIWRLVDDKKK
jgi:WD40 repeat protein